MRVSTWWIMAVVVAGAVAAVTPASAQSAEPAADEALSDEGELARIVSLVESAKYEECAARLDRLLDTKSKRPIKDPAVIEPARVYHATCLIGLGKPELADVPLRAAIRQNPQMRPPDGLVFPPRVVERFLRVRESMFAELQAAEQADIAKARKEATERRLRENDERQRMLQLERLASEEIVVEKHRRWIGLVPFGVGQFQNGNQALGWAFFGTELVLGTAALTALGVHASQQAGALRLYDRNSTPAPGADQSAKNWHLALNLTAYGFVGVSLLGVAEAQLSFVPEVRHVRKRPLPKLPGDKQTLRLVPDVAVGSDNVSLGVRGSF